MRILSWNILQGGGRRTDNILATIQSHQPDIVALQEFRHSSSKAKLIEGLEELGLSHNYIPDTTDATTHTVALFSYYPIECKPLNPEPENTTDAVLALQANISIIDSEEPDIDLITLHLPHKQKQLPYFKALQNRTAELKDHHAIMIGDFNCGIPFEDSETKSFYATQQFQSLLSQGWTDAWRSRNPDKREYTWVSSRKGNGFRYDHALVTAGLDQRISHIEYDHEPREAGFSDHSLLIVDIE